MSEDLIQDIIQRLVATFQPEQVILFGSHAWGNPTPDSDIDLEPIRKIAEAFAPQLNKRLVGQTPNTIGLTWPSESGRLGTD